MTTKRFDCVDMMHRGAKRIYRATKGLSRQQELEYWKQKAAQLAPNQAKHVNERSAAREERETR